MTVLHLVVPGGIDDPELSSGGNVYDARVARALVDRGWSVVVLDVPGSWPSPEPAARRALDAAMSQVPDGGVVLVDGLVGCGVPEVVVPHARRCRVVVLVHLPLGVPLADADLAAVRVREGAVLSAAAAVVATSTWTRRWLLEAYGLPPDRVHVGEPGVDPAEEAPGTPSGGALLCVAAVTREKGHDVLVSALAKVPGPVWRCVCVGPLARDQRFVAELRRRARDAGVADRVQLAGPRCGPALDEAYAAADLLVLASRVETYGMVVTEALARALPVVATNVGGVPETLGAARDGTRPGLLVPPDDPPALAGALRAWLDDGDLRCRLRRAAAERRTALPGWPATAERVCRVLEAVAR